MVIGQTNMILALLCATSCLFSEPVLAAAHSQDRQRLADATGQPPALKLSTNSAVFTQITTNVYQLGQVQIDRTTRSVTFPAAVNMREGIVEYAVVTTRGKVHESVFRTEADPQHIHLALLLLGARPPQTNAFPANLSQPTPGQPVLVRVTWKTGDRLQSIPLESCIHSLATRTTLSPGPWAYNGSFIHHGEFQAQQEGSIISIQIDPAALVNNPRAGREDDTLHQSNPKVLPSADSRVDVVIELPQLPAPGP